MNNLVLVSHGDFCKELKNSAEMILGPQENIYTVSLLPNEGEKEFSEKFEAVTQSLDGDYTVFADLMGGTPCNIAAKKIMNGSNFDLYAGMNMPMIISFVNASLVGNTQTLVTESRESIVKVNDLLTVDNFDEEDE
ncbi:PTS sugar transporter subunit IIA [Carnobacterium mobile]|uniref:PTS sugar transporter subunit IIA n=1 Tax=Carnobacterium mobile TaxID=2750 RepID=UPI00054F83E7|nr:PTS sugar transporter subunit IIA [Carnobacterium mobile]